MTVALPTTIDWSQAACLDSDPDMFVPDVSEPTWGAKLVCARCPIKSECRAFGLSVQPGVYMGVYGGLSQQERYKVRRGELAPEDVDERDAPVIEAGGFTAYHRMLREQSESGRVAKLRTSRDGMAKRCSSCDQWLHESEFPRDAGRWDGRMAKCRECHNAHRRVGKGAA